jgi:hypothetical protein
MKVLLDECIPRKLKYALHDHDCKTSPEAGFAGQKNGRLLSLAEGAGFELFLTVDKGLQISAEFGWPPHRDSSLARQVEPTRGLIAASGSVSSNHEFDPAR